MAEKRLNFPNVAEAEITLEESEILRRVLQAMRQIKFGYVQVTIQDSRVIQIERSEKMRLV